MRIKMLLSDNLKQILKNNNIEQYQPAYNGEACGLDLYSVKTTFINGYTLNNLIPTGLRVIIPDGYVGLITERGSITKGPHFLRAGVIDKYTGEVFVNLATLSQTNCYGTDKKQISEGEKLPVQLLVIPCLNKYEEVNENEFNELSKTVLRKDGKVGSSDEK